MFSSTLKRSAATLGVVAGLLAATAPANAQILDGPVLAKAGPQALKPSVVVIDLNDPFFRLASNDTRYARGTQVGSEGVKAPTTPTANGFIIDFAHTDVKAPTNAEPQPKVNAYLASDPSSEVDNTIILAGAETGNPER